jgi:ribosomal protein S18 acetylase RimI-like enzyme
MNDLPARLFANPVWNALHSVHRHLSVPANGRPAVNEGSERSPTLACRYPPEVVPFVSIAEESPEAFQQAGGLMAPNESAWIIAERFVETAGLKRARTLDCYQMVLPEALALPELETSTNIVPLDGGNAQEMVELTDVAFPGFFRPRTYEMGSYFGIRFSTGKLIAMGGERLKLDGYSEVSAVCTHPDFRGHAYGTSIIWEIARMHRRQGVASFLHVGCANEGAVKLYLRMGFSNLRKVTLHQVTRIDG